MIVLVLNSGSSSLKYQLFDMSTENVMASGLVEKIGESVSSLCHKVNSDETVIEKKIIDHKQALNLVIDCLSQGKLAVLKDKSQITVVGHRVVHGGEEFQCPTLLTNDVVEAIEKCVSLAPLHNPANLTGIQTAKELFPMAAQVGVFDTAFHQTMPAKSYMYALPTRLYEKLKIRRYGFHGTSHFFVAKACAQYLEKDMTSLNLITFHIGNGASVAAIKKGHCIETSMGMTPLEGLVMGTRTGDLDPAITHFLMKEEGMSIDEVNSLYNKNSGLKGLCEDNDLREIWKRVDKGDQAAQLAVDLYCHRIRKYLGSYIAVLDGKVDAIIFTAGVGQNDGRVRQKVLENLTDMGIEINADFNQDLRAKKIEMISTGRIKVLVIPTNEELEIARQAKELLAD